MKEMKCKRCGANENRIHGFCSMGCETAWEYEDEIRDLTARIAELTECIGSQMADVYTLKARIAELEAAQRWIPVSERLPEEDTDGNALMAICRYSGEWVRTAFGAEFADEFVRHYSYWMYAPQPPEVQE